MNFKRSFLIVVLLILNTSLYAENRKFTGFWKDNCSDAYGVRIKPYDGRLYSVSFCGPGGCFKPGEWMPNTTIINDPTYRIITDNLIEIYRGDNTWDMYQKCTSSTAPELEYAAARSPRPDSDIVVFQPYKGLPDYKKACPFVESAASTYAQLKQAISRTRISSTECDVGVVPVPDFPPYLLSTNICRSSDYKKIQRIVSTLAPSLDEKNTTFRIQDYNMDGERELLVEHVDISDDPNFRYPYLSLWMLQYADKKYRTSYAGPFLSGDIHSVKSFGTSKKTRMFFIKHVSCIACEPWIYLTIVDFSSAPVSRLFEFTYAEDHHDFDSTIEYKLPGFGHSIDAEVDSRIPAAAAESGPHFLQNFDIKGNGREWWVFTCSEYHCDYKMYQDNLPQELIKMWDDAEKL